MIKVLEVQYLIMIYTLIGTQALIAINNYSDEMRGGREHEQKVLKIFRY